MLQANIFKREDFAKKEQSCQKGKYVKLKNRDEPEFMSKQDNSKYQIMINAIDCMRTCNNLSWGVCWASKLTLIFTPFSPFILIFSSHFTILSLHHPILPLPYEFIFSFSKVINFMYLE